MSAVERHRSQKQLLQPIGLIHKGRGKYCPKLEDIVVLFRTGGPPQRPA